MDNLFAGLTSLLTPAGQEAIAKAHVCVIGLGGVGSWTVEALVRTGVGELTLIDLDEICISNLTRQLHTTLETVGKFKIDVMADRVKAINPQCKVHLVHDFLIKENAEALLSGQGVDQGVSTFDFVFDAIDSVLSKCLIINYCQQKGIPCLTVGASGALLSPLGLTITDLNSASHDPLLTKVRQKLRQHFQFPKFERKPWGVPALYIPRLTKANDSQPRPYPKGARSCQQGIGAVSFVTGCYGFYGASFIIETLIKSNKNKSKNDDCGEKRRE